MFEVKLIYPAGTYSTVEVDAPSSQEAANSAIADNPAAYVAVSDDGAVATALSVQLGR